jgi:hypothetical protein
MMRTALKENGERKAYKQSNRMMDANELEEEQ